MIKVIKHGEKQKFTKTCPKCGCEFEYEIEDLREGNLCLTSMPPQYRRYIVCPECHEWLYHDTHMRESTWLDKIVLTSSPLDTSKTDPCETCPNKDGPKDVFGNPTVGDSPCQWCPHYKWRITWDVKTVNLNSADTNWANTVNYTTSLNEYNSVKEFEPEGIDLPQ